MPVHPIFDIEEQVWVTERGVVARSLRELKCKLKPNTKIVGYYPDGFQVDRPTYKPGDPVRSVLRTYYSNTITTHVAKRIDKAVALKSHTEDDAYWARQKAEYEAINQGTMHPNDRFTVKKLEQFGLKQVPLIEQTPIVPHKPRRHRRSPKRDNKFWNEHDGELRALVYHPANYKAQEIADMLGEGLTKNAIIGRCHRIGAVLAAKRRLKRL